MSFRGFNNPNRNPNKRGNNQGSNENNNVRTLSDLNSGDDFADDDKDTNFFTGGEKSGLQVQDNSNRDSRNEQIRNILEKLTQRAREDSNKEDVETGLSNLSGNNKFSGRGFRLGTENIDSEIIPDPNQREESEVKSEEEEEEEEEDIYNANLIIWKDGFTIDETFYSFENEENQDHIAKLSIGFVPAKLFPDLKYNQKINIELIKREDEKYDAYKLKMYLEKINEKKEESKKGSNTKKTPKFYGTGHRLGSVIPNINHGEVSQDVEESSRSDNSNKNVATQETKKEQEKGKGKEKEKEKSEGDTTVMIRFADRRNLKVRVFKHQSIDQIFKFVDEKIYENNSYGNNHEGQEFENSNDIFREWFLCFTYPLKEIEYDPKVTIEEAGLANSVVIQRWKK
ncbi:protein phosphatase regulator SHP1 ASCRUDRAFT_7211 [Ascoidea rubescens DSM 1968]|uniref:SEP-domain-containing protein n=1 Tax=Ascoidea rubescens DSM 1968 TaxID=1344418 RepID=A0A1D2VM44_9ASCO|nr:hypothetical protein ASCRUDRAFT_7211 [Ascoidea rubescens DSM 1968]ODV62682.1 hypothetical protein ASCRUDRAFT_7211 [Ascoidea rubescens DSM 1968]